MSSDGSVENVSRVGCVENVSSDGSVRQLKSHMIKIISEMLPFPYASYNGVHNHFNMGGKITTKVYYIQGENCCHKVIT